MDYAALPPEINSARIMMGPGSAPLVSAAASWTNLSAELHTAATSWQSVTVTLLSAWNGPSSVAMLRAATSHIAWITQAATHAEITAAQATMAADAYEMARAAIVPLPMVTANRLQLMTLVATNILGQNTAAIAATEAQYMAMWAQDVAVMGAYQGISQATTSGLPALAPAVPAGTASVAAISTPTAAAPASIGSILSGLFGSGGFLDSSTTSGQLIQAFISSGMLAEIPIGLLGLLPLFGISSGVGAIANEIHTGLHVAAPIMPAMTPAGGSIAPIARAVTGAARPLGGLGMSVPPSWASTAQPVTAPERSLTRPLPAGGRGFMPAPIPMAITARNQPGGKKARGQSVEDSELLKTARFTPRDP